MNYLGKTYAKQRLRKLTHFTPAGHHRTPAHCRGEPHISSAATSIAGGAPGSSQRPRSEIQSAFLRRAAQLCSTRYLICVDEDAFHPANRRESRRTASPGLWP